jgi:cbb3-type cytochrome oxidase subunit 3
MVVLPTLLFTVFLIAAIWFVFDRNRKREEHELATEGVKTNARLDTNYIQRVTQGHIEFDVTYSFSANELTYHGGATVSRLPPQPVEIVYVRSNPNINRISQVYIHRENNSWHGFIVGVGSAAGLAFLGAILDLVIFFTTRRRKKRLG